MATKNFKKLATKKLNALLATANEEDKAAIEAELAKREQMEMANAAEAVDEEPLTPEEEAAIEAAENNDGLNPLYSGRAQNKAAKLTDEERHAIAAELKGNLYHMCQVVPFNSAEWVDGYIAGVVEDKRSNKVLYAIKTNDSRRIVKVHDSKLLKILDTTVTLERKKRKAKDRVEWTPERVEEELSKAVENVGKKVDYRDGRIVAIVIDKRAKSLLYKIATPAPTAEDPEAVKFVYKVTSADLQIAEDFDEEGLARNKKYRARLENKGNSESFNPQERVLFCEEAVKKAEERLQKAEQVLEAKRKVLAEAKAKLEAYLAAQAAQSADAANEVDTQSADAANEADPLI